MPRPRLTITTELHEAVARYQRAHGLSSWAQAACALIVAGLRAVGMAAPEDAARSWGGKRVKH